MAMVFIILLLMATINPQADPWQRQRDEMVRTQLVSRGISSPAVLDAFRKVPRHRFVPETYQRWAYADQPLLIGEGQTISQPYIVAYMTEVLNLAPGEKVLEIGTGSGYQAAILAETGVQVFSVELNAILASRAKSVLRELGYQKIHLKTGDGYQGWPEHAPYNAILVTCSPTQIPAPLKEQLAEGGRMIIPVGEEDAVQNLIFLEKQNGKLRQKNVLPVRFVPMTDVNGNTY